MKKYSQFLAQTFCPLSFCAKLLFGHIQVFVVLGILIIQPFQLIPVFKKTNKKTLIIEHGLNQKSFPPHCSRAASLRCPGKIPLTSFCISCLEFLSPSSSVWASFFSFISPSFSFVSCSRASAVLPEVSVA